MNTVEINRLTRYLEELESIQSSLLSYTYAVESENELGQLALEMPPAVWMGAVTRMQRLQNVMRDGLMHAKLNETEPAPKVDENATPKEHPEDFHMRIEYVLHAFARLAEHCEHNHPFKECSHPKNDYGCFVNDCPLLVESKP